jgi:hypothetical protein
LLLLPLLLYLVSLLILVQPACHFSLLLLLPRPALETAAQRYQKSYDGDTTNDTNDNKHCSIVIDPRLNVTGIVG